MENLFDVLNREVLRELIGYKVIKIKITVSDIVFILKNKDNDLKFIDYTITGELTIH